MKKIITVLLLSLLTFTLLGCDNSPISEEVLAEVSSELTDVSESVDIDEETKDGFIEKEISEKDISISAESDILRIKNLTDTYFRDVTGNIIFFDEYKNIVDIYHIYINGIPQEEFISYQEYYDVLPEMYDSYVIKASGYISTEKNLKDSIEIKSNSHEGVIYSQVTNNSDKTINNVDVRISFYNYGHLIYSEIIPVYESIKPNDSGYAEIWDNNYMGIDYDAFTIEVIFASEDNILNYYKEEICY